MAEFAPITTQEEFDAAIKERLRRESEKFQGMAEENAALKKKEAEHDQTVGELESRLKEYAEKLTAAEQQAGEHERLAGELGERIRLQQLEQTRMRVAIEAGLPLELAARLTGDTDEDIRSDATALARLIGNQVSVPLPLKETAAHAADSTDAAYKALLNNLKEE